MKLGEAMVKDSLITREQLKLALERQVIFGGRIGTNIVELGILKESELAGFLGRYFRVSVADPSLLTDVDAETAGCISPEIADKYKMVPFKKERNRLHAAMLDPRSVAAIDELRFITGYDVIPYAVTELRLLHALEKYYGIERDLRYISTFGSIEEEKKKATIDQNKEMMQKVKEQFAGARDKEEIIGLLINETMKIAARTAMFIVRGDRLKGLKGRGFAVEDSELAVIPRSLFSDVIGGKNYYRGPLLGIAENEPLTALLSGAPQDCLVIPILIRDKVIGLLYADNGNRAVMDSSVNYIHALVNMAQIAFEIVILRKKIMEL